jgi:hypothetical protein
LVAKGRMEGARIASSRAGDRGEMCRRVVESVIAACWLCLCPLCPAVSDGNNARVLSDKRQEIV